MKLIYIYHSGFIIEAENITLIIDYYKDKSNIVLPKIKNNTGKIYVLSTHGHSDHFNLEVLKWKVIRPDIKYIFSKDIADSFNFEDCAGLIFLDKTEIYADDVLLIKAFGSTDIGVSFYIESYDRKIFHAGDLNNWHWNQEASDEEIFEAEQYFHKELNYLAKNVLDLDVAMFPVDPRLGKDYQKGAMQFVDRINTKLFVPMHFGEKYSEANKFKEYIQQRGITFFEIEEEGQTILF